MLSFPALLQSVKTLTDGGVALNIHSQELSSAEMAMMFELKGGILFVGLSSAPIKPEDIEVREVELEGKYKSPSQQLRACLYRKWENSGSTKTFEEWYIIAMEKIINMVKEQI